MELATEVVALVLSWPSVALLQDLHTRETNVSLPIAESLPFYKFNVSLFAEAGMWSGFKRMM